MVATALNPGSSPGDSISCGGFEWSNECVCLAAMYDQVSRGSQRPIRWFPFGRE
jgi:hypothetical protein